MVLNKGEINKGVIIMRKRIKKVSSIMLLIVFIASVVLIINPTTASATCNTYYVDSINGNDNNSGTSTATPWRSLAKVNSIQFQPGDSILF